MPRQARKLSSTNIYHVMLRGINRQTIFESEEDRNVFLSELGRCKEISGFKLYAFCLMSNHVHLLMETKEEPLSLILRRIGIRYAGWYNRKYDRVGHLFQDRFRSENVETEQYFLTALRYIIQNPMKGGLEKCPGTYRWSSYLAYVKGKGSITDTQYAVDMVGDRAKLIEYLCKPNDDTVMDMDTIESNRTISDDQAKKMMAEFAHCSTISDFQRLEDADQRQVIREMYEQRMSIRQISRLTGRSRLFITKLVGADTQSKEALYQKLIDEAGENQFLLHENVPW